MLFALLLAHAHAGCKTLPTAPLHSELGTDSVAHVEVPLDVALTYYWRAQARAAQLPPSRVRGWIRERKQAERALSMYVCVKVFVLRTSWTLPTLLPISR